MSLDTIMDRLKVAREHLNNWAYGISPVLAMPIRPKHALGAAALLIMLYGCNCGGGGGGDGGGDDPTYACSDGKDNDGDGLVDMADPGCSSPDDNDEYNAPPGNKKPVVDAVFADVSVPEDTADSVAPSVPT